MNPKQLTPGARYHYTVIDRPPMAVTFRHETLNYWMFDVDGENRFILLHNQQVINNLTEFLKL